MIPFSLSASSRRPLDHAAHAYDPISPEAAIDAHELQDMDTWVMIALRLRSVTDAFP